MYASQPAIPNSQVGIHYNSFQGYVFKVYGCGSYVLVAIEIGKEMGLEFAQTRSALPL